MRHTLLVASQNNTSLCVFVHVRTTAGHVHIHLVGVHMHVDGILELYCTLIYFVFKKRKWICTLAARAV